MTIKQIAEARGVSITTAREYMGDTSPWRFIRFKSNGSGHTVADYRKSDIDRAFRTQKGRK